MGYLDYRCHVNEDKDVFLPPKTRQCLEMFANMTPGQIQRKYDILFLQWAEDLHTRAKASPGRASPCLRPALAPNFRQD